MEVGKSASSGRTTMVRSIERSARLWSEMAEPDEKHRILDAAYANPDFRALLRFARELISVDTVRAVLSRVLDVAFDTLPVHRGVVLLRQPTGELVCELARVRDRLEYRPHVEGLVSKTIVERAMKERAAIVTEDALEDARFRTADSVWHRGIRAAVCLPLWANQRIIGFMQVDSPIWVRTFNERDVDFLLALTNLAAVALERIREHHARTRLERYHSPAIVEQVLRDQDAMSDMQKLKTAEVTVLFADLVGFTAIAEPASPEQVAELLGGFCTRTAEAVFAEGGTLDKFIGDCVMAFFGAPVEVSTHALQAVRAALRIHDTIERWNAERLPLGLPDLKVRIGLNSGRVVVGEIGNERRADYTVIGNTVNVAARLEHSVASAGDTVVGDATRRLLGDAFDLEPLGEFTLHGLECKVAAHRLRRPHPREPRQGGEAGAAPGPPRPT